MNNNNNLVRLTESELKGIINEAVMRVLTENQEEEGLWGKIKGGVSGIGNAMRGEYRKFKDGVMNNGLNNEYQGQNFKSRMRSAGNYIKQSANAGDRAQEFNNFIEQIQKYIDQGILGKEGNIIAKKLIGKIKMLIGGDNGRLTQSYTRNGYK